MEWSEAERDNFIFLICLLWAQPDSRGAALFVCVMCNFLGWEKQYKTVLKALDVKRYG
ncbi:hypothetical protein FACS189493_8200 [Spirochaetia bacterium]|nr:hypothetical protein FACS189493_8200 [Spirochaetia bacterium]